MATAKISLNDIKYKYRGAGVFFVYSDESVYPNVANTTTSRLVVGFSKVGWFNRPFYIEKGDYATAELLFGKRDKSLERKGSWFHKSLEVALEAGPVLALNLLALNSELDANGVPTPESDKAEYQSFSVDVADKNNEKREKLYASYFQKERFYIPNAEYLLATRDFSDKDSIINLTNLSQNKLSFIIKKADAKNVKPYAVTVREWYGNEEIPSYLRSTDLISDYFVEVIAIAGDYGADKYPQLSVDPILGKFFTSNGLVASELENFLSRNEVVVKDRTIGCLIPDFINKNGDNLYIETVINNKVLTTGILLGVDRDQIEAFEYGDNTSFIDLIGHRLLTNQVGTISCLSYKQNILNDFLIDQVTNNEIEKIRLSEYFSMQYSAKKITCTISSGFEGFETIKEKLKLGQIFKGETTPLGKTNGIKIDNPVLTISRINKLNNQITFDLTSSFKDQENNVNDVFVNVFVDAISPEVAATGTITVTAAATTDEVTVRYQNGLNTIQLCKVVSTDDTVETLAGIIAKAITDNANIGFTASAMGDKVTVAAKQGLGASANTLLLTAISNGTSAFTVTSFTGGIDGVNELQYEVTSKQFVVDGTSTYYIADKDSAVYKSWKTGSISNGDVLQSATAKQYLQFKEVNSIDGVGSVDDNRRFLKISLFTDKELQYPITVNGAIGFGESTNSMGNAIIDPNSVNYISSSKSISERFVINDEVETDGKTVYVKIDKREEFKVNDYLSGYDENGNPILSRILTIKRVTLDPLSSVPDFISVECDSEINVLSALDGTKEVERYVQFTSIVSNLEIFSLSGFSISKSHFPDGTNKKVTEIYSVLTNTNVGKALADPELSNFRYFVDTFNAGLEPKSKSYLSSLIARRSKCLGLLNAPTVKEFKASTSPRFTTTPTAADPLPELDVNYIVSGGNIEENPDWLYSLPDEEQGASYAGFFFPNIDVRNTDGTMSEVPPACYVSNAFIYKYGTADVFKPTAGLVRGVITGQGVTNVSYQMTKDEYGELIEMGINPIIRKGNAVVIYGNETAYQRFTSVLNNIHVRDMLNTFEIDTDNMLQNYIWDYNDDTLKTTVSSVLRNYFDNMRDGYGAIESYEIVFDRSNNPDFVVAESAAICDVVVVPVGALKKFIMRITLRGGSVIQGGFVSV